MPIVDKLIRGIDLVALDSYDKSLIEHGLLTKCIMCRDDIDSANKTKEHVFPKWLQNQFELWDQSLCLPDGSKCFYRKMTVSCCKTCNGGKMSEWENIIGNAVKIGYDEIRKVNEEIIVWWLIKLYYSKLVRESNMKEDVKNPDSQMIIDEENLCAYNSVYYYMSELIKGVRFQERKPYELYIFRTGKLNAFDYIDDISTHTIYIQMGEIIMICVVDSYRIFNMQYIKEVEQLQKLDLVHPVQAKELFAKVVYYKQHYRYNTEQQYVIKDTGVYIKTEVQDIEQIKEFDGKELHEILKRIFVLCGVGCGEYIEGEIPTAILGQI